MSNFHPSSSGNGSSGNNSNLSASRREARASSNTGAMPVLGRTQSYVPGSSSFDFEAMLVSLHDLFEHDRQIASQSDATRCGICYLYFKVSELQYRDEEGFYLCSGCEHVLGKQKIPMVRYQQK